ncbi:hypothetical protein JMJ77_0002822 [Colletotrichum scovillei]|uniref:Uncharacterized protein n=2 Tax=Colletotrichum scovillei TaxID=1209932 RepID=A0A9P7QW29_9PEZI|nr:hypothetical protein JMJ78_0006033 [Colletotrichum scovillei]KAG7043111.1 hypothetical protein JMJ77_0002822 [Colletotrichum scovillei]KAG7062558.1 hypothetical protein JMJ76_0009406 [Colletotrichum scovillei]
MTVRRSESLMLIGSTSRQSRHRTLTQSRQSVAVDRENEKNSSQYSTDKMKTSIAYIIAAALFGATQAAITPMNNIIRHEYNLNARAGVHGNVERDEPAVAPEGDVLQPIV